MKRNTLFAIGLIVVALLLAACAPAAAPTPQVVKETVVVEKEVAAEPIVIGASLPLTGFLSTPGRKHRDGYELCARMLNDRGGLLGRPVNLIVSDNRSDTEVAVAQHERLINVNNADLLFGTFSSLLTFPTSAVAEQAQMVLPIPSGGALPIWERGFKYLFYFQQLPIDYIGRSWGQSLVGYRERGVIAPDEFPKTAAVIHADDFFANGIAAGLLGQKVDVPGTDRVIDLAPGFLAEAGIEVVFEETWPVGFTDWISLANSIKGENPDLLAVLTSSPDEGIEMVRALQTVGYNPKVYFTSQGTQAEFKEALGDAVNGINIYSAWHPDARWEGVLAGEPFSNQDFQEAFQEEFGRPADEDDAIPFSLCQAMAQAVEGAGTTDNEELREWLASRTEDDPVRTILGDFHWDERGMAVGRDPLVVQWQEGELEFVWPLGEFPGTKDMIYPKPAW